MTSTALRKRAPHPCRHRDPITPPATWGVAHASKKGHGEFQGHRPSTTSTKLLNHLLAPSLLTQVCLSIKLIPNTSSRTILICGFEIQNRSCFSYILQLNFLGYSIGLFFKYSLGRKKIFLNSHYIDLVATLLNKKFWGKNTLATELPDTNLSLLEYSAGPPSPPGLPGDGKGPWPCPLRGSLCSSAQPSRGLLTKRPCLPLHFCYTSGFQKALPFPWDSTPSLFS